MINIDASFRSDQWNSVLPNVSTESARKRRCEKSVTIRVISA